MTTDKYYSIQCATCYNNADTICLYCDTPLCSLCIKNECMNCYEKYRSIRSSSVSVSDHTSSTLDDTNYTFFILIAALIIFIIL